MNGAECECREEEYNGLWEGIHFIIEIERISSSSQVMNTLKEKNYHYQVRLVYER